MNPYFFKANCCVCGGEGVTDSRGNAAAWTSGVRHSDPAVCAAELERKRARLEILLERALAEVTP